MEENAQKAQVSLPYSPIVTIDDARRQLKDPRTPLHIARGLVLALPETVFVQGGSAGVHRLLMEACDDVQLPTIIRDAALKTLIRYFAIERTAKDYPARANEIIAFFANDEEHTNELRVSRHDRERIVELLRSYIRHQLHPRSTPDVRRNIAHLLVRLDDYATLLEHPILEAVPALFKRTTPSSNPTLVWDGWDTLTGPIDHYSDLSIRLQDNLNDPKHRKVRRVAIHQDLYRIREACAYRFCASEPQPSDVLRATVLLKYAAIVEWFAEGAIAEDRP